MLRVERVAKSFNGFKAVDGANLTVEKGQVVAVIGPNGAGKTTLFNLITGHLRPDAGRITFKGEEIAGLPAHRICHKGIARSFQLINIFPRLTVFQNVQVSVLARAGKSGDLFRPVKKMATEETMAILKQVGLAAQANRVSGSLSYGDQKVLEIAIALGNRPELLLLDEPTAGMSPEETAATIALVDHLARSQGLTILFTEHDLDVVFSIAQKIMVMHQGRSIAEGKPDEVRANEEVQRAYLGETA
ncbi:MAG: ABC transporter ATP-binding protein [Clostridia bacterium]|nr:ABC transporter ATP-binding protein [Clostridia bacterium]